MKNETCMSELSSYIDFGTVFADGGGVLDHASRWADPDTLTGERDDAGHDIVVTAAARDEMFGRACEELKTSLLHAARHPEDVVFGYYASDGEAVGACFGRRHTPLDVGRRRVKFRRQKGLLTQRKTSR